VLKPDAVLLLTIKRDKIYTGIKSMHSAFNSENTVEFSGAPQKRKKTELVKSRVFPVKERTEKTKDVL
jgi:hypothetical protein